MTDKEEELLEHIVYMLGHMPDRLDNPYKWNRWLGYIQGQLVALELTSLQSCKAANKVSLMYGLEMCKRVLELYYAKT